MNDNEITDEIQRLHFENFLWILFAVLSILNVVGDYDEEKYLENNNNEFRRKSNSIFEFTLIITLIIYVYFFLRNFDALEKASEEEKRLFAIKLLGSSFLIAGIVCLIFFQSKQTSFIGSPAL